MPKFRDTGNKALHTIEFNILSEVTFTAEELRQALRYGLQDLMQDSGVMGGTTISIKHSSIESRKD